MATFVYIIAYLAIIVFIVAVIKRITVYISNPIHVRWELYPVPHDSKRVSYGGSYLEEADWWSKPRETSKISELKVMIPEILGLKAVWENNRPLWFITYPFHLGLYLTVVFIFLLALGSLAHIFFFAADSPVLSAIYTLTNLIGPAGFILAAIGSVGLLYKRLTDQGLKNYSSFEHYFNLILFLVAMGVAIATWLFVDPKFAVARTFMEGLITFKMTAIGSPLFLLQALLAVLIIAYIPLTHMSHFFMKYFLYHDIRWGDEPNINTPKTDAKIGVVLNYPVTWSAPHIAGHGKETWAEVATFNPVAESEKE